jgi:Ca-activated chloride channel homolog
VTSFTAVAATQDRPVFSVESDLVVVHVAVKDTKGQPLTGLTKDAFSVFEDGRPQPIRFFTSEDAPVTVGLVVDNSGSMQPNRERVVRAASAFAEASNPQDELFVLAFNDDVRALLPATHPFTSDIATLRDAVAGALGARGRTALFDGLSAGLDYLGRGHHERKVLVLVSDGGDNASGATFSDVMTKTLTSNALIYTVAIADPIDRDNNPKLLARVADASGGEAFAPADANGITQALQTIAHDIRHVYTVGYESTNPAHDGKLRKLRVNVQPPDHRKVVVRTRAGYLAGPAESAGSTHDDGKR